MRLLILEDDPKLQAILSHHLIVAGHEVRGLRRSSRRRRRWTAHRWQIISDSAIGRRRARRAFAAGGPQGGQHPALHIILINAPQNANERAAHDCIPKPFDLGRLMAAVRSGLQHMLARQAA